MVAVAGSLLLDGVASLSWQQPLTADRRSAWLQLAHKREGQQEEGDLDLVTTLVKLVPEAHAAE